MIYNPIKYRSYQDLIGNHENRAMVAAVIDTGYKAKYADLIKQASENKDEYSAGINSIPKEEAMKLLDDIKNHLSIAYNLNPNFHTAAVTSNEKYYSRTAGFTITSGEKSLFIEKGDALRDQYGRLNPGEILLSDDILKQLYPDKSKEDFTLPMEVTMKRYEYPNESGEVLAEFTFTVVGITYPSYFHEEDYRKMKEIDIIPFAIYVESAESAGELVEAMRDRYFSWSSTEGNAVALLNKSVNMFFDLFRLIEIMMLVMTVVFLVSYSIRSVKNNLYQIGVIKAIGGRSGDIGKVFILQNILLSATVSALTYIGSVVFIDVANDILIKSFTEITEVGVGNINIISFNLPLVMLAVAATIILGLISTVAPLLYLHNIKPINIIKAKE